MKIEAMHIVAASMDANKKKDTPAFLAAEKLREDLHPIHFYALPDSVWRELINGRELRKLKFQSDKERSQAWRHDLNAAIAKHGTVDTDWEPKV